MFRKAIIIIWFGLLCFSISGCLYREDGVFKKIGDSDYKAKINFMDLFAIADGRPTYINGIVTLEDRTTPAKNVHIILKKKGLESIISNTYTDNVGRFFMSGILFDAIYTIEIDSSEYIGKTEVKFKLNYNNFCEIIAFKK